MHVTIETSGVAFVGDVPCELMSISPKLSNSTPAGAEAAAEHEKMRFYPSGRAAAADRHVRLPAQVPVVDTPADLDEIADCLEQLENVNPYKVYLMPQAQTRVELVERSQMLAEYCLVRGFALVAAVAGNALGERAGEVAAFERYGAQCLRHVDVARLVTGGFGRRT